MNVAIVAMVNMTTNLSDGSAALEVCPPAAGRSFDPDRARLVEVTGVKATYLLSLVFPQPSKSTHTAMVYNTKQLLSEKF